MKTTSIIAILGLSSLGCSTPVEKRAVKTVTIDIQSTQIFYCNSPNYVALEGCKLDDVSISTCRNVEDYFNKRISSIKLGSGIQCDLYDGVGCTGSQLASDKVDGGIAVLGNYGWGDRITSYLCYPF